MTPDARSELEELVSFGPRVTGIKNTVFISPKGNTDHEPRPLVAIDPPDSISPLCLTANVKFTSAREIEWHGPFNFNLAEQVEEFVQINCAVLMDYWEDRISTDELQARLRPIRT
jgi:hypothetical protein